MNILHLISGLLLVAGGILIGKGIQARKTTKITKSKAEKFVDVLDDIFNEL